MRAPRNDVLLQRTVQQLAQRFGSTSGIYVQDLTTGAGAAWNARATFPAASTLKLAIAVTALARTEGTPELGSTLDRLLRQMLTYSDNAAANGTEAYFGGSTSGGSALVNSLMRSVGLVDTEMYGGYELDALGRAAALALAGSGAIPLRVDSQPYWGRGKKSSAYDLASLMRDVWLASGGRGPLRAAQPGFTPADARYLLYLLAHVRDPGKIDREVGKLAGVRVLHKAGWINVARHDNGIVLWHGRRARRHRDDVSAGRRRDRVRRARGQGRLGRSAPLPRLTSTGIAVDDTQWAPACGRPPCSRSRPRSARPQSVSGPGRRYSGNRAPEIETLGRCRGFVRVP